jgi:hypothetical protein
MRVDRDLGKTAEGKVCALTALECASVLARKGTILADREADRLGITAYLEAQHRLEAKAERERILATAKAAEPESKAVERGELEDKGVAGPGEATAPHAEEPARTPGVIMPPETRRVTGNPRRA